MRRRREAGRQLRRHDPAQAERRNAISVEMWRQIPDSEAWVELPGTVSRTPYWLTAQNPIADHDVGGVGGSVHHERPDVSGHEKQGHGQ